MSSTSNIDEGKTVQYEIRNLREDELPQIIELQKHAEEQNVRESVYSWFKVDPTAWKVAVTDSGEILGVCCAIKHSEDFHFLGMYVVNKKYRGIGIGTKVFNACVEYIGNRNAALNSTESMAKRYAEKTPFKIIAGAHYIISYEIYGRVPIELLFSQVPDGISIVPFEESQLPAIFSYDQKVSGYNRQFAVELNCKEKDSKTFVAFKGNSCVGYGTIKLGVIGIPNIGPMYVDDPFVAEVMLKELITSFPMQKGVSLYTFVANKAANEMMIKLGGTVFEIAPRLYIRNLDIVQNALDKVFAHFDVHFSPF